MICQYIFLNRRGFLLLFFLVWFLCALGMWMDWIDLNYELPRTCIHINVLIEGLIHGQAAIDYNMKSK
jgi:hypothetical protein